MTTVIVIGIICILLLIVSFSKAFYHFEYFKEVWPDFINGNPDYLSSFNPLTYNFRVQILIFPFFKRIPSKEGKKSAHLVRLIRIRIMVFFILLLMLLFLLYFFILN